MPNTAYAPFKNPFRDADPTTATFDSDDCLNKRIVLTEHEMLGAIATVARTAKKEHWTREQVIERLGDLGLLGHPVVERVLARTAADSAA